MSLNRYKIAAVAAGALALGALAGCEKSTPEPAAPVENVVNEAEPMNAVVVPEETPAPETTNLTVAEPREAPVDPDVQTLDDADATGMTARVNRDQPTANETVQ